MNSEIPLGGEKKIDRGYVWKEARQLIGSRRGAMVLSLGVLIVGRLSGMVLPYSSRFLIDDVLIQKKSELLTPLAIAVGVGILVQAASSFYLAFLLSITAQRAVTDLRRSLQRHIMRLPLHHFDSTKTGVLISRIMTDADGIRDLVGTGFVQLLGGLTTSAIALGFLFSLNARLTFYILVATIGFGSLTAFGFSRLRPLFRRRAELRASVVGRLTETLGGIRIIKGYTAEKREERVFAEGGHKLLRVVNKTILSAAGISALSTILFGILIAMMMIVGGNEVLRGEMSAGIFGSYVLFTIIGVIPMTRVTLIGAKLGESFAGLDRIGEVKALATEADIDSELEPFDSLRGEVEFKDVVFEYDAGVPVLKNISFYAPAGTTTALVGPSGSGKSTLIDLLMAFSRPKSGTIEVDGIDLATVRRHDYRSFLGIVLQENFLFDGTIAENIDFSKPGATDEEISEVSRIAHCDEFIDRFDNGLQTIVGERGVKLSGGQRQRIAIARAILADPGILILDEATSSLDSQSEAFIQDSLKQLRAGRTTFVIAHRLSTITSADQILVLAGGKIIERGKHEDLLAAGGTYRALYDQQFGWEQNAAAGRDEDPQ